LGNDRLLEHRLLIFDEQVHVVLALDDEDALAGVAIRIRMVQDVDQVTGLDVDDDVLGPDAALLPELRGLASSQSKSQSKYFTSEDSAAVCLLGTHCRRQECAQKCAQTRSQTGQPAAKANHDANEKRA
jgi:hypothetical protein